MTGTPTGAGDTSDDGIEASYLAAQRAFVELARSLGADDWAAPVSCCPGWSVRDVLSHVAGIPDDAMAGRLDGVATEPWTASQVERNRGFAVDELLDRWDRQTPMFAAAIAAGGQIRPPVDCLSHEFDVRQALGRPGGRDRPLVHGTARVLIESMDGPFSLVVETTDGPVVRGAGESAGDDSVTLRGVSAFEIVRSRLGRRSREQVMAYDWSGPADRREPVIADWFAFGPSAEPIVE